MTKKPQTKSERTRQRILESAAKIVGTVGYAKASVALITMKAKIASGGFYYYFSSRKKLFDGLLPALGEEMIAFISQYVKDASWGIEHEVRAFEGYLEYLRENPEFYRVFSEAYVYAPNAYQTHFAAVIQNYTIALKIQKNKGFLNVDDGDITMLVYFLIGIRNYVSQLYMEGRGNKSFDSKAAVALYRTLITAGIFNKSASEGKSNPSGKSKRSSDQLPAGIS
jgi:AcrR family transcriptional regulator